MLYVQAGAVASHTIDFGQEKLMGAICMVRMLEGDEWACTILVRLRTLCSGLRWVGDHCPCVVLRSGMPCPGQARSRTAAWLWSRCGHCTMARSLQRLVLLLRPSDKATWECQQETDLCYIKMVLYSNVGRTYKCHRSCASCSLTIDAVLRMPRRGAAGLR